MVGVLLCITAITSAAVGVVYNMTEKPIAAAKVQKKVNALSLVLPQFDNQPADEMQTVKVDGEDMYVYTAKKDGEVVGYAVESFTNSGFNGLVKLMTGFDAKGNIVNIEVLEQAETPGLGAKITESENPVKISFIGKNPSELKMSVRKDGGDIDAITASTISSRAYVGAVSRAYTAFLEASGIEVAGWDASSGATPSAKAQTDAAVQTAGNYDNTDADDATGATVTEKTSDSSTGATVEESDDDDDDDNRGFESKKDRGRSNRGLDRD